MRLYLTARTSVTDMHSLLSFGESKHSWKRKSENCYDPFSNALYWTVLDNPLRAKGLIAFVSPNYMYSTGNTITQ